MDPTQELVVTVCSCGFIMRSVAHAEGCEGKEWNRIEVIPLATHQALEAGVRELVEAQRRSLNIFIDRVQAFAQAAEAENVGGDDNEIVLQRCREWLDDLAVILSAFNDQPTGTEGDDG